MIMVPDPLPTLIINQYIMPTAKVLEKRTLWPISLHLRHAEPKKTLRAAEDGLLTLGTQWLPATGFRQAHTLVLGGQPTPIARRAENMQAMGDHPMALGEGTPVFFRAVDQTKARVLLGL